MNPTLYNPNTKVIATPNADVTPEQVAAANTQGFTTPVTSNPVITPQSLAPATPMTVSEPSPANGYVGLGGVIEGMATNFTAQQKADADAQAKIDAEKAKADSSKQILLSKITGGLTQSGLQADAYKTTVDPAKAELNDINNQILQEQVGLRRQIETLQKNTGNLPAESLNQEISNLQKASYSKQADLAVIQLAKQNNYAQAKEIADRSVDASLEQQKNEIDALELDYSDNKEQYTNDEQRQFNEMIKTKDREYTQQVVDKKTVSDLSLEALKGGAPAPIAAQMRTATSPEDAIRIGGQYIGSLDRQKSALEIAKLQNEVDAGAPITGEWASVINGASGLVDSTKQKIVKQNIASALSSGNYTNAYAEVSNAVSDGLTGTNKTKFDDSRTDIGVMSGLRNAIQSYVDAGGDVGFLKGKTDNIAKGFGQLAQDPKFAALGVQLQREFQAYRNSMTGSAFTPAESREYAKVNPRTDASLDLNLATIDGALAQLTNRVTSTVNARVPDATKIYDKINAPQVNAQKVTVGGNEWTVGQVLEDAKGNRGFFNATGKWVPQSK